MSREQIKPQNSSKNSGYKKVLLKKDVVFQFCPRFFVSLSRAGDTKNQAIPHQMRSKGDSNGMWMLSLAVLLLGNVYNADNMDFWAGDLGVFEE